MRGPATLHFFLYWVVQLLSGDFSFGISLFIDGSEDTIPPLAAAVAAAMARLAFLCRIPQALQRDCNNEVELYTKKKKEKEDEVEPVSTLVALFYQKKKKNTCSSKTN